MDPQEPRSDASRIERSGSDRLRSQQEGESEQGWMCGVQKKTRGAMRTFLKTRGGTFTFKNGRSESQQGGLRGKGIKACGEKTHKSKDEHQLHKIILYTHTVAQARRHTWGATCTHIVNMHAHACT